MPLYGCVACFYHAARCCVPRFGCAGDLSRAGDWVFQAPAVDIIRTDRTVCVGLSWSLFGRYTSKISDHNRGTNIVHIEWFTVTSYELETLNAPSLKFRVHNNCTKDNCDTKTWCVEPVYMTLFSVLISWYLMNVPKSHNSNFRHRKSTCNKKETGFQYPRPTLSMGTITVLSLLELAQIRISCPGWTHQT